MKALIKKIAPAWGLRAYHFSLAILGAAFYGFPSRDMIVIGVTGTNGKSTVIELLHRIFSDFGFRVASFSSVRFSIRGAVEVNKRKMTMPGRFFLSRMLARARREGCQVAILEVTSEGISQSRHRGISFNAAVFTNLRPEHIESHGSFEAYRAAKGELFNRLENSRQAISSRCVVNLDDPSAFYFLNFNADKKFGFALTKESARPGVTAVIPEHINCGAEETIFVYEGMQWTSPLVGDFNVQNVLAAIATAQAFGIPLKSIRASIRAIGGVPGRLEVVNQKPFRVVVDYAHTPDALEAVLRTARELWAGTGRQSKKGRVIVVMGSAGGGRDKWKRPELGKIAEKLADKVFLTNEDPYAENPMAIIDEIASKMTDKKPTIVLDRKEAIEQAIKKAKPGDVVLVVGKGSEQGMATAQGIVPWDDREVVRAALSKFNVEDQLQKK